MDIIQKQISRSDTIQQQSKHGVRIVERLPMIGWFRRRAAYRVLIEADAKALIERFGEQAYSEARFRQHDGPDVVDANRPASHWERVKEAIRRIESRR